MVDLADWGASPDSNKGVDAKWGRSVVVSRPTTAPLDLKDWGASVGMPSKTLLDVEDWGQPAEVEISTAPLSSALQLGSRSAGEEQLPPAAEPVIVRRTPHMDLIGEIPLRPGDRFSVNVFVDTAPARPGEDAQELHIAVPWSTKTLSVEVWLGATDHFKFRGPRAKMLDIPVATNKSASVRFYMAVRADLDNLARARLSAYFTYQGRPSGQVSVSVPLTREPKSVQPMAVNSPNPPLPYIPGPPPNVSINTGARKPDLSIEIENKSGDLRSFECRISSPHLSLTSKEKHCNWCLHQETDNLVLAQFDRFIRRKLAPRARLLSLIGAGKVLWDLAPAIVRNAIWRLIDAGKLQTILVVSSEPYFPWELIIPQRMRRAQAAGRRGRDRALDNG